MKNKKPLLITLGVLAGIILITVAVTLLLRGRGGAQFSGPEDAPYPYSWTEKNNGTIDLTLETGKASNGVWSVDSTEGSVVEITGGKGGRGKTEFTLKPVEEGRENITFTLVSEEERLAELSVAVMVNNINNKYAATVTAHRERALQGTVRGGEETGHPFTVRSGDRGLTIFVEETEGYSDDGTAWLSESTDTTVAYVSDVNVTEEGVTVQLERRANGSAQVAVYSPAADISYVFDVEVTGGEMMLKDFQIGSYGNDEEPEEEPQESEEPEEEPGAGETAASEPAETAAATPLPEETETPGTESEAQP